MKKRLFVLGALAAASAALGATKGYALRAIADLEKPQGDLFTLVEHGGTIEYWCKNNAQSEGFLQDWIEHNGWRLADQIGEGYFFINDKEETLLLNRDVCPTGRYLAYKANRKIEA